MKNELNICLYRIISGGDPLKYWSYLNLLSRVKLKARLCVMLGHLGLISNGELGMFNPFSQSQVFPRCYLIHDRKIWATVVYLPYTRHKEDYEARP